MIETIDRKKIKPITEKEFQQQVITLARLRGWLVYHQYDSRRSQPGWPDVTMIRGRTMIFAELKSETGKLTKIQKEVLSKIETAHGPNVFVWRPTDWTEIEKALR